MDNEPKNPSSESDGHASAPAEQKPEILADEQLDDAAGGMLTWDGGGGGDAVGGGPVIVPRRR